MMASGEEAAIHPYNFGPGQNSKILDTFQKCLGVGSCIITKRDAKHRILTGLRQCRTADRVRWSSICGKLAVLRETTGGE